MTTNMEFTLELVLLCSASMVAGETGFKVLVFGGAPSHSSVVKYDVGLEDAVGQLAELPERVGRLPSASIMNGKVTLCAGDLSNCLQYENASWQQGVYMERRRASAITTFDNQVWTFLGGNHVSQRESMAVWKLGQSGFESIHTDHTFLGGSCSVRVNQTHAIDSSGSKKVLWYQENGHQLSQWPQGDEHRNGAACGLIYDRDEGYKFLSAGGFNSGQTNEVLVYSFADGSWSEGARLPKPTLGPSTLQYQHTFLVMGDPGQDGHYNHVLKFDSESGWIEMPMKLPKGQQDFGSLHLEPSVVTE